MTWACRTASSSISIRAISLSPPSASAPPWACTRPSQPTSGCWPTRWQPSPTVPARYSPPASSRNSRRPSGTEMSADERESVVRPFVGELAATPQPLPPEPEPQTAQGVRPYLITRGRTQPTAVTFEIETQIVTTADGESALTRYRLEARQIVTLCREPMAVAEIAARLGLHLGVARVLVGDLIVSGHLEARRPHAGLHRNVALIERVIHGLHAIG